MHACTYLANARIVFVLIGTSNRGTNIYSISFHWFRFPYSPSLARSLLASSSSPVFVQVVLRKIALDGISHTDGQILSHPGAFSLANHRIWLTMIAPLVKAKEHRRELFRTTTHVDISESGVEHTFALFFGIVEYAAIVVVVVLVGAAAFGSASRLFAKGVHGTVV